MKSSFYPLTAMLCLSLLGSCHKDPETSPLVLPGEYQAAGTLTTAPILLYTKNGPVDNAALVDKLIARRRLGSYFSRADVPMAAGSTLTLTIRDNGTARLVFGSPAFADTVEAEVMGQSATSFVLASRDSVGGPELAATPNRCEVLAGKIRVLYPPKRCRPIAYTPGTYEQYCRFRPSRLITIRNGQLFIPQLSWLIQNQTGAGPGTSVCTLAYSGEWNALDPAILNQLVAGDTIVVQQRQVALLRQ